MINANEATGERRRSPREDIEEGPVPTKPGRSEPERVEPPSNEPPIPDGDSNPGPPHPAKL